MHTWISAFSFETVVEMRSLGHFQMGSFRYRRLMPYRSPIYAKLPTCSFLKKRAQEWMMELLVAPLEADEQAIDMNNDDDDGFRVEGLGLWV